MWKHSYIKEKKLHGYIVGAFLKVSWPAVSYGTIIIPFPLISLVQQQNHFILYLAVQCLLFSWKKLIFPFCFDLWLI